MNLKVFTAFSGYDSQCMALDRLHEHNPHFNYELVGWADRIQQAGISRSQQYKMAGNSIVVSCMYHIWRRLWIDTHITNLTLF